MLLGCYKAAGRNDRFKASCPEGALGVEYIQCGSIGISGYLCLYSKFDDKMSIFLVGLYIQDILLEREVW